MKAEDIRIEIPERANFIIHTLEDAGYEAYIVGGCVRDSVLGRNPKDWDITTSAQPMQVKALFRRTIDTGIAHGTVTVMQGDEGYEVTTYRIDGKYEDGRHPKEVTFTPNLKEDLLRRDFTINAMAYNDRAGLVDMYGGIEDLEEHLIRCVGDPVQRFGEDALRMLRAIRFSAQLSFTIEEETKRAIAELSSTLSKISAERIYAELVKTLISDNPMELRVAYETGLTSIFLPEFDEAMKTSQNHPHHMYSVGEHILHSLENVRPEPYLRLAMLFHDIGKPETLTVDGAGITHFHGHPVVSAEIAKNILRRLKSDNDTISKVGKLVRYHDYGNSQEATSKLVRRAVNLIGKDLFEDYIEVRRADILAQSNYLREEKLENVRDWEREYENILKLGQCVSMKSLAVTGRDLIQIGIKPGPRLGEILAQLLEEVLDEPEKNEKEYLLARVNEIEENAEQ